MISELNNYDRACLVGHYNSTYVKESIDPRIFTKGYSEAHIRMIREKLGRTYNNSCGLTFTEDYHDYHYDHFNFVIMAYHAYDKSGQMPFKDSLSEQPAQILEIFEVLSALTFEREEDSRRKQEKGLKKRGK